MWGRTSRGWKSKRKNDTWTMEESNELLALLVDACKGGWRNTNDTISKQLVENKILPQLNAKLQLANENVVFKPKTYDNYISCWRWFKNRHRDTCTLIRFSSGFAWDKDDQKFTAPEEVWMDFMEVCTTIVVIINVTFSVFYELT